MDRDETDQQYATARLENLNRIKAVQGLINQLRDAHAIDDRLVANVFADYVALGIGNVEVSVFYPTVDFESTFEPARIGWASSALDRRGNYQGEPIDQAHYLAIAAMNAIMIASHFRPDFVAWERL